MPNTHGQPLASDGSVSTICIFPCPARLRLTSLHLQYSTVPRALKTKTPPPAFINLDDCKPIISTTATNTSSNSSAHGRTAFVFTSSRTLRALQDQDETSYHQRYSSSPSITSIPSSPSTSSTTSSPDALSKARASLTLSQLIKHSEGAIDARSLLGPNMRAAGFVNLPNNHFARTNLSCPSSPASVSHHSLVSLPTTFPTPRDPPDFPPIHFVNLSHYTTMSMWEHQNQPEWHLSTADFGRTRTTSVGSGSTRSSEYTPGPRSVDASSSASSQYARRPSLIPRASDPGFSSSGISLSTPFSPLVSSPLSLSAVEETDEPATRPGSSSSSSSSSVKAGAKKGKARQRRDEPTEYPFPAICDSPRSQRSTGSRGSRASSATASPTIIGAIPPAAYPAIQSGSPSSSPAVSSPGSFTTLSPGSSTAVSSSPSSSGYVQLPSHEGSSSRRRRRSSKEKEKLAKATAREKEKARAAAAVEPTPSFSTAKRLGYQRPYSLTELCDSSPFVWVTKSDMFAPPAPIARSPVRAHSTTLVPVSSRPPAVVDPDPPSPSRHRRHHTTAYGSNAKTAEGRAHRIASEPLRMPPSPLDAPLSASTQDSEKARKSKRIAKGGEHALATNDKDVKMADTHGGKSSDALFGSYHMVLVR